MLITKSSGAYPKLLTATINFITRAKDPTSFLQQSCAQLDRLCLHIGRMDNYDYAKDRSQVLIYMIQEIVPVWFTGGDDLVDRVTIAMADVMDTFGGESLVKTAAELVAASGTWYSTWQPDANEIIELGEFAGLLIDMGNAMEECWNIERSNRKSVA